MAKKIALLASETAHAQNAYQNLLKQITPVPLAQADIAIAIGGDGLMLQVLHQAMHLGIPVYGVNRGSYGFLMNNFTDSDSIMARIETAEPITLYPLVMECTNQQGEICRNYAINEISLFRRTAQIAKLEVFVDGQMRMESLWCDGIIVATAAGSTAYNYAAFGSILPLDSKVLALTPLAPFRPPRWRGALLYHHCVVTINVKELEKRPVSAVADNVEIIDVAHVKIWEDADKPLQLLFDPDANLADRILEQQFAP